LDETVPVSEEDGFYDLPADAPFGRLPVDHEHDRPWRGAGEVGRG
jgi:hypothetical protein